MFLLSGPEKLLVLVFLVTTVFCVGLNTGMADLRSLLASRNLVLRALVANFVIVPLVGFALVHLVPLAPPVAGALILLACVPGGLSTIQFTSKIKGEGVLAGAMVVLLGVLAILVSPVIIGILRPAGVDLTVPYGRVLGFIALAILIPLGSGIFLHDKAPGAAPRLSKLLGLLGVLAFVAFTVVTGSFRRGALAGIGGPALGAMALLIVVAMLTGWFLGGPARGTRQLLATVTSMRSAALCLAIAKNTPSGDAMIAPLIAFSLMMAPPNMLLTLYSAIRVRKGAGRAGESRATKGLEPGKR